MSRKHRSIPQSGRTLLLADDDLDYLEATRLFLESEGHRVLVARNGPETLKILRETPVDLLLLDYFMPGMTGEEVVQRIREFDREVQVVLQTGYASEQPPREMLRRLEIQGYYDKSEGPEKLLLWTDAGLKAAHTVNRLSRDRRGLNHILGCTPELQKMQPLSDLLEVVLTRTAQLPGSLGRSFSPEIHPAGFLALVGDDSELVIEAASPPFLKGATVGDSLPGNEQLIIEEALARGTLQNGPNSTVLPLRVGNLTVGVLYLAAKLADTDRTLFELMANQATVAIHNVQLYELAALDPLTGVMARPFFDQWLRRELRAAFRVERPVAILLLDVDDLESINQQFGQLAGNQALAQIGTTLRHAVRENDVIGRWGEDEFLVVLPNTNPAGVERVANRVTEQLPRSLLTLSPHSIPVHCSLGLAVLDGLPPNPRETGQQLPQSYFMAMADALLQQANSALAQAKLAGGGCLRLSPSIGWNPIVPTSSE